MATSCQANGICFVESSAREHTQSSLNIGFGFWHTIWTCLCCIYATSTIWDLWPAASSNRHCHPQRYQICHYCNVNMTFGPNDNIYDLLDTLSLIKKPKKKSESLNATPMFSARRVSNPIDASIPPVPEATSAVVKSSVISQCSRSSIDL